ncbi:MAG: hypothetical protein WC279_04000 [Sulfurimonas sp.]|jgi:hypothetical protein|uniref:hypothetical protein n=1 Tax=unclassified Sulfurimonas TaxID=2623549 RepID=UPI0008B0B642|nr:hypothetical protein [Sulfurimonas sp. RIFOXYB12_FULL_35_9]OHE05717.1 MAG: hypothetical protein A2345_00775 [Sulfurimonas sp. RIFOXYB12_FULL_35_9]
MYNQEANYLKVLKEFNSSNLLAIETKFGNRYIFKIILVVFLIVSVGSIFYCNEYSNWIINVFGLIMMTSIFFYFKYINNKATSYFGENCRAFIKQNEVNWRGVRALIFFENIQKEKLQLDEKIILDTIDKELNFKKFEILKTPVFIGLLTVWGMLINSIFDKTELPILWIFFFILLLITYFSYGLISVLRTEESKMNDLKLFIHWYKVVLPTIEKFKMNEENINISTDKRDIQLK